MTITKKVSFKFFAALTTAVCLLQPSFAQKTSQLGREAWVDSVFQTLNNEEKIGQLIAVRVPGTSEEDQENLIDKIKSYRIGTAIFMKGSPVRHARVVNEAQESARVPLFLTAEMPTGLAAIMDSTQAFPNELVLGALKNDSLANAVRREIELQKKILGFQNISGLNIADISGFQLIERPKSKRNHVPAFQAGSDIILEPKNISGVVKSLKRDLRKNEPLQQQLDATVKKILAAKYDAGLSNWKRVNEEGLVKKLNSEQSKSLSLQVIRKSIALISNQSAALPVQSLENKRFASINVGANKTTVFSHTLTKYAPIDQYAIKELNDVSAIDVDKLNQYDYVFIGIYPITEQATIIALKSFFEKLQPKQKVFVHFGDPAQLKEFTDLNTAVAAYDDNTYSQNLAAQMIFGALEFEGKLSVTINPTLTQGISLSTPLVQRFSYVTPEEAGMDSKTLEQISYIVKQAIDSGATPGCHVFVAHKGKVVFDRSFGSYKYDNSTPVTDDTIYDLASITKVAATLEAVMFLTEKGMIDVNKKISVYLPELRNTNKKDITIKDMLTHQSGLLPFIPMWPNTVKSKILMPYYYSTARSEQYPLQVAPDLFVNASIRDSAWHWAISSKMTDRQPRTPYTYRYSDMGSMIFHRMVERLINQPMNEFLEQHFYEPLGATTMGYLPLERFSPSQIAPTEIDTIYRKQLIHGTVHDERAAMMGGVAGHAGLFGNANDLGKIGQMLLNGGSYGGVQFFKPETVAMFTSKQYDNSRRGLGWDKPTVGDWNGPTSELCSPKTFGHTGFTGTCIWVDPEFDLVFVFLSNRVWPDRNNKLLNANIRPRVQEVIYKSIFNYCQFHEFKD